MCAKVLTAKRPGLEPWEPTIETTLRKAREQVEQYCRSTGLDRETIEVRRLKFVYDWRPPLTSYVLALRKRRTKLSSSTTRLLWRCSVLRIRR